MSQQSVHHKSPIYSDLLSQNALSFIQTQIERNNFIATSGGFSQAKRGLVVLPSEERVFAKMAVDEMSQRWLDKERAIYQFLNSTAPDVAPKLLGSTRNMIVLPDLSALDWSSKWDQAKFSAVISLLRRIAEIPIPGELFKLLEPHIVADCLREWREILDPQSWRELVLSVTTSSVDANTLPLLRDLNLQSLAMRIDQLESYNFGPYCLVHFDVRADNLAFDPASQRVMLVDWNWAELGSSAIDKAVFGITALNQERSGLEDNAILAEINPQSALLAAGLWLNRCREAPIVEGDANGLRKLQLMYGVSALKIGLGASTG